LITQEDADEELFNIYPSFSAIISTYCKRKKIRGLNGAQPKYYKTNKQKGNSWGMGPRDPGTVRELELMKI